MAKQFLANRSGQTPTLDEVPNEVIKIYDDKAAADLDLANIEENEIVATKAGESEGVVEVVDTVAPFAVVKDTYYIKKGGSKKFYKNIFCGDNHDKEPDCYVEGEYDVNKVGTYPVTFKAVDDSGNSYTKKIKVVVYKPSSSGGGSSSSSTTSKTYFSDVVEKHKKHLQLSLT